MKKFMKAIAFATVMCMLLSVAAFAANEPDYTIADGGTISVTVTDANAANKQIAFVAANADITEATDLATGNILDVQQVAFNGSGVATVTLNVGDATAASVFYGYEGVGESAAFKTAGVAEVDTDLRIVLDGVIEVIPDAAADPRYVGDAIAESDKGALVYATVAFENYDNEVVTNIGWQFINEGGAEKRIDYPVSGLEILEGEVQVGVAFTNGNGIDRAPFVTESTNVSLWFKFADKLLQAVAE